MNLPNRLTMARIGMSIVFIALMSIEHFACLVLGYMVFIAASITDYYDGKLARQRGLVTNFGKLADPVADKILLSAAFIMAMLLDDLYIPGWTVVVILAREFLVTGARSLAASDGVIIAANKWGKTKTVLQIVYINCCFSFVVLRNILSYAAPDFVPLVKGVLYHASLWGAVAVAIFTVYSGFQFIRSNWSRLNLDNM